MASVGTPLTYSLFFVFLNSAVVWQEVSNNLILANCSCSRHNVRAECVQSTGRGAEALGASDLCVQLSETRVGIARRVNVLRRAD